MESKEIESKVKEIIKDTLMLDETPRVENHLTNDLGCDSLDAVEILMACEKEFDISIPDDEGEKVLTVEGVISVVSEKLGKSEEE